jgi:FAD/FMN-containing dehydrogenase
MQAITAEPSTKFSIKSGGHSPNKGASNTDGGVLLDLGSLKSITPLSDNWDVIGIGAGAKSVDAYRVLDPHNRTVIGGRVASIGLGGFLTGGMANPVYFPYTLTKMRQEG